VSHAGPPSRSRPGLKVDGGIVVDQHLQTDVVGIYTAGDVGNAWRPRDRWHLRVEQWSNALNLGTTTGRNAASGREVYERLPHFFSDQYDLGLEYVGAAGRTTLSPFEATSRVSSSLSGTGTAWSPPP